MRLKISIQFGWQNMDQSSLFDFSPFFMLSQIILVLYHEITLSPKHNSRQLGILYMMHWSYKSVDFMCILCSCDLKNHQTATRNRLATILTWEKKKKKNQPQDKVICVIFAWTSLHSLYGPPLDSNNVMLAHSLIFLNIVVPKPMDSKGRWP